MRAAAHIVAMGKNTVGDDLIIGDVHGSATLLKQVIVDMGRDDRLFIVGDLFDRGEDSPGVFKAIKAARDTEKKIYVVRGNHEDMLVKTWNALKKICKNAICPRDFFKKFQKELNTIALFIAVNGGDWIVSDDTERGAIQELLLSYLNKDKSMDLDIRLFKRLRKMKKRLMHLEFPNIIDYVNSLPYIIKVGESADYKVPGNFVVCHADLPFRDDELDRRIGTTQKLNAMEIHYTTWARERDGTTKLLTDSLGGRLLRTYVGHTTFLDNQKVYDSHTNRMVLDSASYETHTMVVINETKKRFTYVQKENTNLDGALADCTEVLRRQIETNDLVVYYTRLLDTHSFNRKQSPPPSGYKISTWAKFFGEKSFNRNYPKDVILAALNLVKVQYASSTEKRAKSNRLNHLLSLARDTQNDVNLIHRNIKQERRGIGYGELDAALGYIQRAIEHNRRIDPEVLLRKMKEHEPNVPLAFRMIS